VTVPAPTTRNYEEAVPPRDLQALLTQHIKSVIDRKAFNRELAQQRLDAPRIAAMRKKVLRTLRARI
jgi:hypothetical protein